MANWNAALDALRPNDISKTCAVLSGVSTFLPWLVLRSWSVHAPPGVLINVLAPREFISLAQMAAGGGPYLSGLLSLGAVFFIAGAAIAWWSPIGGILQIESICAIAVVNARASELFVPVTVRVEYGLGVGVFVGLALALMTVLSLCPPVRDALLRTCRTTFGRARPRTS